MEARISIIIPCYKAKATLERCLDSLRRQSVPIEALLVEDCSNDGTLEAAQEYFDAIYDKQNVNKTVVRAFQDACIFDTGWIYVDNRNRR